jgi:hypothetical protein
LDQRHPWGRTSRCHICRYGVTRAQA